MTPKTKNIAGFLAGIGRNHGNQVCRFAGYFRDGLVLLAIGLVERLTEKGTQGAEEDARGVLKAWNWLRREVKMKRNAKWVLVVGLLFGVMSRLYLRTPFGYIGMFDLVSYGLAPVLFVRMAGKLTSREHGYLAMILLWVFGSAFANPANGYSGAVTLKAVGITASIWCMSVVCFALLTASPLVVLYFLIGNYLGAVIGLYIFQNGAYLEYALNMGYSEGYIGKFLVEKQVLPAWLSMICMAGGMTVLLVWRRCPYWVLSVLFFAAAFMGLYGGGSRSTFGFYFVVGVVAIGVRYYRLLVRGLFRNFTLFATGACLFILLAFSIYSHLAKSGALGEGEKAKYEEQYGEGQHFVEVMSERGMYGQTMEDFKRTPLGSGGIGALRHSAISDAIYKEGLFAIPFWLYFVWILIYFIRNRLLEFDIWAPFVGMVFVTVLWNAFGSPFGGRGTYCFVGSLAVLSKKPEFMAVWNRLSKEGTRDGRQKALLNRYR